MVRIKGPTGDAHFGRPKKGVRLVNPATEAGSTYLFPDYQSFRAKVRPFMYGRAGTPTHRAFEENLMHLEGAAGVSLASSGLGAVTLAISSFVSEGEHLLLSDSCYDPIRSFCDKYLTTMGVETTYFDPLVGENISALIRPNTQLIFCESPGSLTFEIQDLPAIITAAGSIPVAVDNTYGAGVHLKPLSMGAAISVQSLTKYVGGHSDLLMGAVMSKDETIARKVARTARLMGLSVSAADVTLAHRGLRTLHRRLEVHEQSGLAIAKWLEARPEVAQVLHPGLPSHPQHALWQRDFTGSNGLFSILVDWEEEAKTEHFLNALQLYGLGYSWGGFESLCLPCWPQAIRTAVPWTEKRQLLRFHIGLEDVVDLTADLEQAFDSVSSLEIGP
ncbi:MAG: cystathionine beta-lyase [Pseudomonadota bacterium]